MWQISERPLTRENQVTSATQSEPVTAPAKTEAGPPKRKHYHDIDGARSVLMFLSVALHAGTVYAPLRPWITSNVDRAHIFDWLIFGLHLFITPTFFFVGGFFAVLLLTRRTPADFLWNRFLRTAVPLVFIALTFNMLEHYLRWGDAGGEGSMLDWIASPAFAEVWSGGTWQLHLWFLVSLIPMFLLAAVVQVVVPGNSRARGLSIALSDRFGGLIKGTLPFVFGLLFLGLANTVNYASAAVIPGSYDLIAPGFQSWYKLTSEFPFFVIGVMAALSPRLLAALVEWRWWMPYAAVAAFAFQPYAQPGAGFAANWFTTQLGSVPIIAQGWAGLTSALSQAPIPAADALLSWGAMFCNQLAIWTLVLFILQFFHRFFNDGGPRTTWLADCALSMYLFHHCFIYIYGQMFVAVDWPIAIEFALLTVISAGTVIAIHDLIIRRFALARLLGNGKTDVEQVKKLPGFLEAFALKPASKSSDSAGAGELSPKA